MKRRLLISLCVLFFSITALAAVKPGVSVCADWNGSFYLATVVSINGANLDVLYADGDKATLATAQVRELPWDPQLKTGDTVLASWNNSAKLYDGTVIAVAQLSYQV